MTPHRVSPGGSFEIDRRFPGVGRIRMASGAMSVRQFRDYDALLSKLKKADRVDLLRALKARRITLTELADADRRGQLGAADADVLLSRTLADAIAAVAARKGADAGHFRARLRHLPAELERVRDLADVDWAALARGWTMSAAEWNHVQRATSRLLSLTLGKFHPFTRQVRERFVWKGEPPRVPDLTPEAFERVLGKVPAELRPCYRTLVLTGMRRGEYLRCTLEHLMPELPGIRVPGTKTAASAAVIPVARSVWPWVEAAVPCPVSDWMLRTRWYEACDRAKVARVRLHDLRHCTAQWLVNAGRPEAGVQRFLRHVSPATTRRYTLQRTRSEDAAALAAVLVPVSVPVRKAGRRKA